MKPLKYKYITFFHLICIVFYYYYHTKYFSLHLECPSMAIKMHHHFFVVAMYSFRGGGGSEKEVLSVLL